ncbi:uncharacterized protein N7518_000622 [Penicillium psychrosexuale]|uniref:uncharacterized protein n=1 Tax=Penicillium psychrosexuale TaxID=1002107 RepID=UPI002544D52E|nr:uncharacterized protein N7518_000622 [Penicillium psychrosexuale]KAJ5804319.1 hypothetical protein N7518_000622 [Penicillium psychrosexuale]
MGVLGFVTAVNGTSEPVYLSRTVCHKREAIPVPYHYLRRPSTLYRSNFPPFHLFSNLYLGTTFPQQLILQSICSILYDRSIFDISNLCGGREITPAGIHRRAHQIGPFPEIRLTAPSPAPTSDQVDPLRTSDSPAEGSACECTSPRLSLTEPVLIFPL